MTKRPTASPLAIVILAAGKGTRMKDQNKAKVMFELGGKPMIHYVADLAKQLAAQRTIVIVGFQRNAVVEYLRTSHPSLETVTQEPQLGTGHAVAQVMPLLHEFSGDVLVLSGDVPLLTYETLLAMTKLHRETRAVATMMTAEVEDPRGYGRVIRNQDGSVRKIVEHRDANDEELRIREINSGIYVFDIGGLAEGLEHLMPHNVQNEYYLTDVFEYFWKQRRRVSAYKAGVDEIRGINTTEQLQEAHAVLEARKGLAARSSS